MRSCGLVDFLKRQGRAEAENQSLLATNERLNGIVTRLATQRERLNSTIDERDARIADLLSEVDRLASENGRLTSRLETYEPVEVLP